MRHLTCLLLAVLAAAQAAAGDLGGDIEQELRRQGLTGATWSLLIDEKTVVGSAGVADATTKSALQPDAKMQVGSVTKTVLAAAVLRLVTEGRIGLDAALADIIPDVEINNPWQATTPITVRHLLDHTSGLDDVRLWHVFSTTAEANTPLKHILLRSSKSLSVRSRPGSRFSYSNIGYTLVGHIIETVTGQPYEQYVDDYLLKRLSMRDSTFKFVTQASTPRLAMGHFEQGRPYPILPSYVRPATQFTTTAADMARFAHFLMSDGRVNGEVVIRDDLLAAMGVPARTEATSAGLNSGYGLGLGTRERAGTLARYHDGNAIGFRAAFCIYPEHQKAFFIAINTDSEQADLDRFDRLLINALGVPAAHHATAQPSIEPSQWNGFYTRSPSRFAQFKFLDLLQATRLYWTGTQLQRHAIDFSTQELRPMGANLFAANGRSLPSHGLTVTSDGTRVLTNGFSTDIRTSAPMVLALWSSSIAGLLGAVYVLVIGLGLLLRRRLNGHALLLPFIGMTALLSPLPFFLGQSFMRLGELTIASGLLAITTALLPIAVFIGIYSLTRYWSGTKPSIAHLVALLALLQWTIVLAAGGLLPLVLWT